MLDRILFFMSVENLFFHTSGRSIYFWYIYVAKTIFQRFVYKIQADIYQKTTCRAPTLQKEIISLHTLIRTTRTCIYPQYRVLLGSKFSKFNELFCNYKDIFLCSSHNSYFVLLCSVHIPAVLYNVLASTCSSILNVYVATCFYLNKYIFT